MTTRGVDYAWQHPDPGSLAAAGYSFACRYLSRDPSKNLTLTEAQALAAHGIWCVANWEYGAQDMLRGYAGGVADAMLALQQATAAGMPKGRPVYFSADWDVTPEQESAVTEYLKGAASVLGADAVGEYAGFYPVRIARDNAAARWTWQTSAWSGGQWDPRGTLRQTGSATVGGVQVDVNEAMVADFGQWMPGRLPAPAPSPQHSNPARENDMHVDLKPNAPVVFANPAAVLGGTSSLLLASDFGDVTVRVATFETGWSVQMHTVARTAPAVRVALPAAVSKVSVELAGGIAPVGLDVLA